MHSGNTQTVPLRGSVRRMYPLLLLAFPAMVASAQTSAPQRVRAGVSRDLAQMRGARVSDLRYDLSFALERGSRQTHGTETLIFRLTDPSADLPLDYRDGTLEQVSLNDHALAAELREGHLILPADHLRAGENTITMRFASRVDTAGAAITRYEDKEDGGRISTALPLSCRWMPRWRFHASISPT